VFLKERSDLLLEVLPLRCQQEDKLTESQKAEVTLRYLWIGETLRRGGSTMELPAQAGYNLLGLVHCITAGGEERVNPHVVRTLHSAFGHMGLELAVPVKPASGWFGYEVMGEVVY